MIDLHSHILPGLDDGARTIAESREIARRAAADGVRAIAATPHVRADWPTRADEMERRVLELRDDFAAQGIAIEVLHGGEIDLEMLINREPAELRRFTLAQSGRYLLVEFPYVGWPLALEPALLRLLARDVVPLLAHPERNREVQTRPERIARLVGAGALVQVTAASLDGRLGRSSKAAGERLIELGLVHVLASDAHSPDLREAGLAKAAAAIGADSARYLTEEAPAAIVAGEDVPEAPRFRRRRFGVF
jgi:protein-tyrosine phosphatase